MISVIRRKAYGTLRDLCSPTSPKEKGFSELCQLLQDYYKPKRLEVAETYRFHPCIQEENESVSSYSARLRHHASTCNFGEFLNRSLRDQFVSGIRSTATRKKLLNEDRTFQDALKVAVADEVASKETLQFHQEPRPSNESVNAVGQSKTNDTSSSRGNFQSRGSTNSGTFQTSSPTSRKGSYACFSCGGSDHAR